MRTIMKTVAVTFLAATLVLGVAPIGNASPQFRHGTACKAGLAQLRSDRGRFDNHYDRILGAGIIGTACAADQRPSAASHTCLIATRMFEQASPLFKTRNDRRLGRGIMRSTCA